MSIFLFACALATCTLFGGFFMHACILFYKVAYISLWLFPFWPSNTFLRLIYVKNIWSLDSDCCSELTLCISPCFPYSLSQWRTLSTTAMYILIHEHLGVRWPHRPSQVISESEWGYYYGACSGKPGFVVTLVMDLCGTLWDLYQGVAFKYSNLTITRLLTRIQY